jgi:hypothetical protein
VPPITSNATGRGRRSLPGSARRPRSAPRPPSTRRLAAASALSIALTVLPGCSLAGGAPWGAGDGAAGGADSNQGQRAGDARAQAEPVWREFTRCVRSRGYPDLPDPIIAEDGSARLPQEAARVAKERHSEALRACQPVLRRLPAGISAAIGGQHRIDPPTAEDIVQLRRFAGCMRQHGVPEWPDPGSDGTFPLSGALAEEGKSTRILAARRACDELSPDAGKRIVFSGPAGGGKP